MAQPGVSNTEPPAGTTNFLKRLFGRGSSSSASAADTCSEMQGGSNDGDLSEKPGLIRRVSRKVVPGLPRVQTFKRQQSEKRTNLAPVKPTPAERRAVSVDRRAIISRTTSNTGTSSGAGYHAFPRASAPELFDRGDGHGLPTFIPSLMTSPHEEPEYTPLDLASSQDSRADDIPDNSPYGDAESVADTRSVTSTQIHEELEKTWILNLSMHFRDKSKREKFFVTYRERDTIWRRVTVSVDYRGAPANSLEDDLLHTKFQREKSSKIYEAIRESLGEIQFYETVTNLKLQTTDGRLHVHVVEDVNEIIDYPTVQQVRHLGCSLVRERDISFDSHMSGFVYKVNVGGAVLIKKEIPGPDTIDEFLYEVNALNALRVSKHVIRFYGLVVDDQEEFVKGLLISYADQGALIEVIFDHRMEAIESGRLGPSIPWPTRVKWARQVVEGLSDIHESGFVQGDFTLSNIVIDSRGDAKIIDINRRGCPVGWEPPEATPLIASNQRISMYIGVKSDLFQLGMVLWALALEDDEPELHKRPLVLSEENPDIPDWYRQMTEICLSENPRMRMQASSLLSLFPADCDGTVARGPPVQNYLDPYGIYTQNGDASIRTISPSTRWPHNSIPTAYESGFGGYEPQPDYPVRGRSPPRHFLGSPGAWDAKRNLDGRSWSHGGNIASYSDAGVEEVDHSISFTPTPKREYAVAADKPVDFLHDAAKDVFGHDATTIEEAPDVAVGDDTPNPTSASGGCDGAAASSIAVEIFAEGAARAEHSSKLDTVSQVDQGSGPVPTIGIETFSEGDKSSIGGSNGKPSGCLSKAADPGNTEPDVQIVGGTEDQGLQSEADASGVAAEDAKVAGLAEPSGAVDETDNKNDAPEARLATETPSSEDLAQSSTEPPRSPRAAKVPDALAGVGAAHDAEHPDLMNNTASLEEELRLMNTTPGTSTDATTGTTELDK